MNRLAANFRSFAIWYLRTSYLANVKDGIGERLISVNNSILNTPGFRAAGWSSDPVQRTYSPPIPTKGTSEYFQNDAILQRETSQGDEEEEGGMVTGRASNDTVGPGRNFRRRRRKETMDDDDSSDLSDESDDGNEGGGRAAQQIRFAKMPGRRRSDSSPIRSADPANPDVMVTSPSKPSDGRRRTPSLGAVEATKARARANTATSSDMSSENEIDPAYFQRRQVHRQTPKSVPSEIHSYEEHRDREMEREMHDGHDDSDVESIGSAASSDLGETVDSATVLSAANATESPSSSPILAGVAAMSSAEEQTESPKRQRSLPVLQDLPRARPISVVPAVSALSKALNAQRKGPSNPLQSFAALSAKAQGNPLWIKIYAPFSEESDEPYEMPLARTSKDDRPVIVAEAIGLALLRYQEEERKPELKSEQLKVNKWMLRLVDDGEVDYDFPPIVRTRPMIENTPNNNKGGRARSRAKPWDEFALIEATAQQQEANDRETPQFATAAAEPELSTTPTLVQTPTLQATTTRMTGARTNAMLAGQPFASALTNTSVVPADKPDVAPSHATPRIDKLKTVRVRYFDIENGSRSTVLELSADSYIGEILDNVCKKWGFQKGMYVLKVAGTNTVAPLDRTLEALGTRSDLELVQRRYTGFGGASLTGSLGSSSPNAPLLLDIQGPTKKGKKEQSNLATMAQKQDILSTASNFKKFYVSRKQLASLGQGNPRVLIFDGDFMHIMPGDTAKSSYTKTSSVAFSSVLKCKVSTKHSKIIRLIVQRLNEQKRYDFEARTAGEAQEIVDDINRETRLAKGG